jgi:hypothetical protein
MSTISLRKPRRCSLAEVVTAAKRQTFAGKCEASAFLAIVANRDLCELREALRRYALDAGLDERISTVEIERVIEEALSTARATLDEAAE